MKQTKGILRIGTSNIVVPGTKKSFPFKFQQKTRLHYYSSIFNSVELNSTFYKLPMHSTFEKWANDVNEDFRFTIKLWKEITHVKELKNDLQNIHVFLKAADGMGNKKGCLLVQFPGKINLEYYNQVEQVLETLATGNHPGDWRVAVEFRNPGWYVSETFEMLDEFGASLVAHDIPKAKNFEINKAASFVYLRFHGPKGDYRGSYQEAELKEHLLRINGWLSEGKDVYAYFNNTIGEAFENAFALNAMAQK